MMKHTLLLVGELKDDLLRPPAMEYLKRLQPYAKVQVQSVPEVKIPSQASPRDEQRLKEESGQRLMDAAESLGRSFWIALDERGKQLSSRQLAAFIDERALQGDSHLLWIVGGALGLSQAFLHRCHFRLSLSKMTFLHEMVPMLILEQIYRSHRILRNEPYHR